MRSSGCSAEVNAFASAVTALSAAGMGFSSRKKDGDDSSPVADAGVGNALAVAEVGVSPPPAPGVGDAENANDVTAGST